MSVRSAWLAASLVAMPLAAVSARAQGTEYSPSTNKYRFSAATHITQTVMGNATNVDVTQNELLSLTVARKNKDTVTATFVVDSIAMTASGPSPDLAPLKGKSVVSLVSPNGKFYSSTPPAGIGPEHAQIVEQISRFLPAFRSRLSNGATWTDTTDTKTNSQGLDVSRNAISTYRVTGDTTIAGQKAFKIERSATIKATGSGTMQGTPVTMSSTGTSVGAFYIGRNGVYMGANSTDDSSVTITVLAQNMEVAIKQSGKMNVELVR